ncbi:MAG: lipopolysaccharide biosynthesis protein [Candidatus Izemoplasmatales bacterium]
MATMKKSEKLLPNMLWSFGERISAQIVTLIVTIVLARILDPEHYSVVAIITLIITLANSFVTGGFGNSLIQKKDADDLDFSTTLIFSTVISVVFYIIMYLAAPLIANYYEMPEITIFTRVMSLRLILAAFNSIQQAYISKKKEFKKFFYSTLFGTLISGVVGVLMAYLGYGTWALVAQYLLNTTISTIILSFTCGWKPKLQFSFQRMKGLFSYGWKLLVAAVAESFYNEAQGLVLSKSYSPVELSYYSQGSKYPALFSNNIEVSMQKVLFQELSDQQNNIENVKKITRRTITILSFILVPIYYGIAACGDSLVKVLLADKWIECVKYMQVISFVFMFQPIAAAHNRALKAIGKSGIFLILTIIRYSIGVLLIAVTIVFIKQPIFVVISGLFAMLVLCITSGIVNIKHINYSINEQLNDTLRTFISGAVMFVAVYSFGMLNLNTLIKLIIQVIIGVVVYLAVSLLINKNTVQGMLSTAKKFCSRGSN